MTTTNLTPRVSHLPTLANTNVNFLFHQTIIQQLVGEDFITGEMPFDPAMLASPQVNTISILKSIKGVYSLSVPWLEVPSQLPTDENGKPYIPFKHNGRKRLLDALLLLPTIPELSANQVDVEAICRELVVLIEDISVFYELGDEALNPSVYLMYIIPTSIIFYHDSTNQTYQQYKNQLDRLERIRAENGEISTEFLASLRQQETDLFYGEENTLEREKAIHRVMYRYYNNFNFKVALALMLHPVDEVRAFIRKQQTSDLPKAKKLFPNSDSINLTSAFAMPKFLANNLNRGIRKVNIQQGIEQYKNGRQRKASYKIQSRDTETEFVFDREKLAIDTVDKFARQLGKLKDAKVIQTYFGLMKLANLKDTPVLHNIPLSELMALVLKSHGRCKFNTADRHAFSDALKYLASISITVHIVGESKSNKGKSKSKVELKERSGVRLFDMEAVYSVKKEFQSMSKEALIPGEHFDTDVINRFSGKILPDNQDLFTQPGSVYFDTLLQFDSNKDGKAVLMGFSVQTRFSQMKMTNKNKKRCIEMDRASLIELCDYQKTNQTKPSKATKQLANNLDKLMKAGIISRYEGLTNNDNDRVRMFPPVDTKGELTA